MKYVLMALAVVALFAGQALASDGNVSNDMLSQMGLSGMQTMTDAQGTAVRGMGYSMVYGTSVAYLRGSVSSHGYYAEDSGRRGSLAAGASVSAIVTGRGRRVGSWVIAGGGSIAITP